ncbi:hypothetical protein M413DRAFT_195039 [Hebeloma cylindrosporum]|uniref:Uncharacterized protein n=1 Tax=Hebeloma cylindrosporum TaxID=76867 RepID=A0A0C3C625_HEBCY|nr:hypothetical protein M413DRAFT_195039 [Hebeloma cylindrosporum h7]
MIKAYGRLRLKLGGRNIYSASNEFLLRCSNVHDGSCNGVTVAFGPHRAMTV